MENLFGLGLGYVFVMVVIPFAIMVALSRWIFRVNAIHKRIEENGVLLAEVVKAIYATHGGRPEAVTVPDAKIDSATTKWL
jgi:hypothetical protein